MLQVTYRKKTIEHANNNSEKEPGAKQTDKKDTNQTKPGNTAKTPPKSEAPERGGNRRGCSGDWKCTRQVQTHGHS